MVKYASEWMEIIRKDPERYEGRKFISIANLGVIPTGQGCEFTFCGVSYANDGEFVDPSGKYQVSFNLNAKLELMPIKVNWDKAREHMENGGVAKLNSINYIILDNILKYDKTGLTGYLNISMLDSEEWELI